MRITDGRWPSPARPTVLPGSMPMTACALWWASAALVWRSSRSVTRQWWRQLGHSSRCGPVRRVRRTARRSLRGSLSSRRPVSMVVSATCASPPRVWRRPPKKRRRTPPRPCRSRPLCCSQEVPPHVAGITVVINSILPRQEAFMVDAPTTPGSAAAPQDGSPPTAPASPAACSSTVSLVACSSTASLVACSSTASLVVCSSTVSLVACSSTASLVACSSTASLVVCSSTVSLVACSSTASLVVCSSTASFVACSSTASLVGPRPPRRRARHRRRPDSALRATLMQARSKSVRVSFYMTRFSTDFGRAGLNGAKAAATAAQS